VITTVEAGPYTVRGVSVGGVYTSLQIPELGALLDVGIAARSFAGVDRIFLSHGHADHIGALTALLGIRGLLHKKPPSVYMPAEIVEPLLESLATHSQLQHFELAVDAVGMNPGDEHQLRSDLHVRAFRTRHPVPSLGYQFFNRVNKLKSEFAYLSGREIGRRRRAGEDLFDQVERLELAYATDTLIEAIEENPTVGDSRVLIMECSFLDERKSLTDSRAGCHIHLDELLERADLFRNERLVLMHFSQIYSPKQVRVTLARRCPKELFDRIVVFAPPSGQPWPG